MNKTAMPQNAANIQKTPNELMKPCRAGLIFAIRKTTIEQIEVPIDVAIDFMLDGNISPASVYGTGAKPR
jgi:hypothetical protein